MKSTNFKEFFQEKFFRVDRKYVDISMPRHMLAEMAVPLDIAKKPVKIDQDDISFLQQFPSQYWTSALHQRYSNDLKDALKERQTRRDPVEQQIYKMLNHALMNGDYSSLQGHVSDELITRLQNKEYGHVKGDENLAKKAARHLAELETEKKIPHIVYPPNEDGLRPGHKKYTFRKHRNGKEVEEIIAKPYMNRLVHKLERNRDQEHHPDSGLRELGVTHGQYGYDLYDVKEGDDDHPHATRGMPLPTDTQVSTRLSDFLNHNGHHMYGKLPEGPDIVWKEVGLGRTDYKDNWAWKKVYNKFYSQYNMKLQNTQPGAYTLPNGEKVPPHNGFKTMSQLRKAAQALAKADVIKLAEDEVLVGPPIPGIAPNGLPVKVKKNAKGEKTLSSPPLYLPHKKKAIWVQTPNGPHEEMREIPLVNPAQYLRELGTGEDDDSLDADSIRGYAKDYVHVPHNDYTHSGGYLAGGALHMTHNSAGRHHLDPSDPEYQERKEEVERMMGMTSLDGMNQPTSKGGSSGEFFYDIIKGIWNCISSACGGMTGHEVEIMRQNVPDLHQMIYQKMMMNLRDEKLNNANGRRTFAKNAASSWAQQDLGEGGGTRRLRRLRRDDSESTVGNELNSLRDTIAANPKINQGGKFRPAGNHEFSYHIDNLRSIIGEMEKEADKVDSDRDDAIRISRSEISDQIADLIGDAITDKAALIFQLQIYLSQLFQSVGLTAPEAENRAMQKVQEYSQEGKNKAKAIIAAFKADEITQKMLSQPDNAPPGISSAAQDAMDILKKVLSAFTPEDLQDPVAQQKVYNHIKSLSPELQPLLTKEADRAFGKTAKPAVMSQNAVMTDLITKKDWLNLSRNPYFLYIANPNMLNMLIGKLETALMPLPEGLEREKHEFAIAYLQSVQKKKSAGEIK